MQELEFLVFPCSCLLIQVIENTVHAVLQMEQDNLIWRKVIVQIKGGCAQGLVTSHVSEYSRALVTIYGCFYGLEEEMLNKGHSLGGSLFRLGYVVISALCMCSMYQSF